MWRWTVRMKSRPAIFNLKALEAVIPRFHGNAQACTVPLIYDSPLHKAQRQPSNTLCLCPCCVSAFPRRQNSLSLSLDDASKAWIFLVTISSQRKRPNLGSETQADVHAKQGRLLSLAPGHEGTRAPEAGLFPKLLSSANNTERFKQRSFLTRKSLENLSRSESGRQFAS